MECFFESFDSARPEGGANQTAFCRGTRSAGGATGQETTAPIQAIHGKGKERRCAQIRLLKQADSFPLAPILSILSYFSPAFFLPRSFQSGVENGWPLTVPRFLAAAAADELMAALDGE